MSVFEVMIANGEYTAPAVQSKATADEHAADVKAMRDFIGASMGHRTLAAVCETIQTTVTLRTGRPCVVVILNDNVK